MAIMKYTGETEKAAAENKLLKELEIFLKSALYGKRMGKVRVRSHLTDVNF